MMTFPVDCATKEQELEYLVELQEALRLWHNQMAAGIDNRALFFDTDFFPRSREVERLINERVTYSVDAMGTTIKTLPPLSGRWNPDISVLDYAIGA